MRNIVITGASDGIGRALALELLKTPGNRLFLISRNQAKMSDAFRDYLEVPDRVFLFPYDLAYEDYSALVSSIVETAGHIDILVNNAGALVKKPFTEITSEDFQRVVDTNFRAPFFLIQQFLPHLVKGSHIVNISSMGGFQGSAKFPGLSLYSASKGALSTLTEVLAAELSDLGIYVNCLAIGSVNTTMLAEAFPGYNAPITAESMAEFLAWFAVNGNRWINGKVLPVSLSTP
ncbi:MAG: SDR family oxidoreductase [Chloroflexota bacterium]